MKASFYRDTWAEIDLSAIDHNIRQMAEKLPDTSDIIAIVKADGYGHGSVAVAKQALKAGAKALGVALLEEALELRKAQIDVPILVLGWVPPRGAPVAAEHDITLTFFQEEWLEEISSYTLPKPLKVHMKWDTGMGRIGLRTESELRDILYALNKNPSIYLTGVFTHFATADEKDFTYLRKQQDCFEKLLAVFREMWPHPVTIHTGNSAASIRLPGEMYDAIRFGISMYGLYPSSVVKSEQGISLKQAFSLHSRLVNVKQVAAGDTISYGRTYSAQEEEWIGTIPIGYGDGWIRKLQGMDVLADGKRMPIVGRICMDQTMIRLDQAYPIGTKVTLIGHQQGAFIDMDEVAAHLETINYEIPCMINERVPRIYSGSKR
ncbi:alanine racemase [Lentibacillus sediminis]|uniref:alanine racemase n=1 Tax=Lentibacillus sediminis TaxID=1940529 RepID=UPI000C1C4211|nr:alanine racemase [Lentibacillus sediminis]